MPFADVQAKTTFPGFSAADEATILDAMRTAYNGSATAKTMFDNFIATAGNTINITRSAGDFEAEFGTGRLFLDLSFLTDNNYITPSGKAVEDTAVTAIVHELSHALTGRDDDGNYVTDYKGANVEFVNQIYRELGIPEQVSYIAYDAAGNILTRNFEYTNGATIDRAVSDDRDWNSSLALFSDDLLIGGPSANRLESGLGDDFLFGGGGDDFLNGGLFGTDTAVLTGEPVDYDIRLNPDGTWTSRHVRGTKDEGTDTFKNLEKVQFEGGETFDLEENRLTFQTDFAFVVDQTGSMFDDIDAVKASATAIIDALFAGDTTDARVGVVGFRDNTIGEPTQVIVPFTDQDNFADRKAAALAAINSLGASGGGDEPETAFDGLLKALDGSMGDWREGAGIKRVALFTDASAKDAFLLPTVLGFARDIGAVITASSSEALGTLGSVDTFELSFEDAAARDPSSEGDVLPDYVPSEDPIQPPGGTATVQIFTIFIETFIEPDPSLVEISESSGGDVLTAATPEEVVERLLEVIDLPPDDGLQPFPDLEEKVPVDPEQINGVPQEVLTGDGESETTISFVSEVARFRNTLGFYLIDEDGTIGDPEILFADISSGETDPTRPGDTLDPGDAVSLGVLEEGQRYGLFLIPDGWFLNGDFSGQDLVFRNPDTGGPVLIGDRIPPELLVEDAAGNLAPVAGLVFHTADPDPDDDVNELNPNGIGQVQVLSGTADGAIQIGFEDKLLSEPGTDGDFNDVVLSIEQSAPLSAEVDVTESELAFIA